MSSGTVKFADCKNQCFVGFFSFEVVLLYLLKGNYLLYGKQKIL